MGKARRSLKTDLSHQLRQFPALMVGPARFLAAKNHEAFPAGRSGVCDMARFGIEETPSSMA